MKSLDESSEEYAKRANLRGTRGPWPGVPLQFSTSLSCEDGGGVVQVCVGSTTHVPSNRSEILVSILPTNKLSEVICA